MRMPCVKLSMNASLTKFIRKRKIISSEIEALLLSYRCVQDKLAFPIACELFVQLVDNDCIEGGIG